MEKNASRPIVEMKHHEPIVLIYDARGNGTGGISPTITGDHQNRVTDYTALVVEVNGTENIYGETVLPLVQG